MPPLETPPPEVLLEMLLLEMLLLETLLLEMLLPAKTLPRLEMLEMAAGEGGDGCCRVLGVVSALTPPMPPLETPPQGVLLEMLLPETLLLEMLLPAKTLPRLEMLEMAAGEGGDGCCRVLGARLGMGR